MLQFVFPDALPRERQWWLVVEDQVADLCRDDPGHDVTLVIESSVRALTEVWTGDITSEEVIGARLVRVVGVQRDAEALWRWLGTSAFAPTDDRPWQRGEVADPPLTICYMHETNGIRSRNWPCLGSGAPVQRRTGLLFRTDLGSAVPTEEDACSQTATSC